MAIKTFKEILNNQGYRISSNDRKIFEEGNLESFFGFSQNDAIEFIVYDLDDNQLPQINDELVRYIPLTTQNIKDYFLIAEGTVFIPWEQEFEAKRSKKVMVSFNENKKSKPPINTGVKVSLRK